MSDQQNEEGETTELKAKIIQFISFVIKTFDSSKEIFMRELISNSSIVS